VLAAAIELLGGGLPPTLRPTVEDALAFVFAAHGYTDEGGGGNSTPPRLSDIVATLRERAGRATGALRAPLEALVQRLEGQARSGLLTAALRAAHPDGRAPLTAHSLAGLPEEHRSLALLLSLDQVWNRLRGDRPALVVVDGIDLLVQRETCARFVADLAATAAERRGALESPLRDFALSAGMKVLLRQTAEAASMLADLLHLSPAEQSWLATAEVGEGLLLARGERLAIRAIASEEEYRLITEGGA
jgi:hypothetical protein